MRGISKKLIILFCQTNCIELLNYSYKAVECCTRWQR